MILKIAILIITLLFFIFYLVYNRVSDKILPEAKLCFVLFVLIYITDVIMFTLLGRVSFGERIATLAPGTSYRFILNYGWPGAGVYEAKAVIGNALMFVPFGIIICTAFSRLEVKQKYLAGGVTAFAASLIIEFIQYISTIGTFEVDDLIHNTWGALIGCGICCLISDKNLNLKKVLMYLIPLELFIIMIICVCAQPYYQYLTSK